MHVIIRRDFMLLLHNILTLFYRRIKRTVFAHTVVL